MARTNRINKACANYHIMSRTNGRQFLFKNGRLKSVFVNILRRSAEFSGVKIHAYCMMDDHFHLVCNIAKPDKMLLFNLDGIYMEVCYVFVFLHMYETFHIKKFGEKGGGGAIYNLCSSKGINK